MKTIYTVIAIFGITAILGMYMLSVVLPDKETPKGVPIIYCLLAFTGLILLITYYFANNTGPLESIVIFSIAALGGLIPIYKDVAGTKITKWRGIAHELPAVVGYIYFCFVLHSVIMYKTLIDLNH